MSQKNDKATQDEFLTDMVYILNIIDERTKPNGRRRHKWNKDDIRLFVEALRECVLRFVEKDKDVELRRLGKFRKFVHTPRKRYNPKTGGTVDCPEEIAVKFTVSETIFDDLNQFC